MPTTSMISESLAAVPNRPTRHVHVPPLQSGDRLSRDEFERRYHAMPEKAKAELIRGVVYVMASPLRAKGHGEEHFHASVWLGNYKVMTTGVRAYDNSTVHLDADSMPQPDLAMLIDSARGGQARIREDGYIEGAPELVVEIAASSVSYDLHDKLEAYEASGVLEYVVWRVFDEEIDWFELVDGRFVRREPDADGLHRSVAFPGLWLDPAALLRDDLATVLERLRQGLATPEHAAFVARLNPPLPTN